MKTYKCIHCADLGIVSRCSMGEYCACAQLDSGVACERAKSVKCSFCNPVKEAEDETAHIQN